MKLCPQCDFIYEDDQGLCDMDGRELVYHPAPPAVGQSLAVPTRLTISLPEHSQPNRFPLLLIGTVVLAMLLSVLYFVQLRRSRFNNPEHSVTQVTQPSAARDATAQTSSPEAAEPVHISYLSQKVEGTAVGVSPDSNESSSVEVAPNSVSPEVPSRVTAGVPHINTRQPVVIRLNNGATIKADEVWETKEGIWYRQGSVVTLLKKNQVRAIEEPASSSTRSTVAERNSNDQTQKTPYAVVASRRENSDANKDSRVTSFLKKTGRILKKPFKF